MTCTYLLYACLQTGRIMVWWCPSGSPSNHFPHFSPTSFDILSWNFAHDFVLLYYRSSSSVVTLRQFLKELCLFVILEYRLYFVFVLPFYRSSSSVVNLHQFLWELCPFWNFEYWKYTVFRTFLLHALTYWAESLHMTLFHRTTDQVRVLWICFNCCRSYAPFGT